MGCDYYADENGVFEMEFFDYIGGTLIGKVLISGLEPNHPIGKDLIKGEAR